MEIIYTWSDLVIAGEEDSPFEIRWTWDGLDHAANERWHFLEAESLWRMTLPKAVIDPVIDALRKKRLQDCHDDFQRLAKFWEAGFLRVFALPRVLRCRAIPKRGRPSKSTPVLTFVNQEGVVFIVRSPQGTSPLLRSFYFPKCLVKNAAFLPQGFERNAVEFYADLYSQCNSGRLPASNERHVIRRAHEIDRDIRFVSAEHWGFESDQPNARWVGFDVSLPDATAPGAVDPPPRRQLGEGDSRSSEDAS